MPVTTRGMVQLSPDTTSTTSASTYDYLNSLSPSLADVRTGLAVFALVIIARFCAVQVYTWLRRIRGAEQPSLSLPSPVSSSPRPNQLHNNPPYWTMDNKEYRSSPSGKEVNLPASRKLPNKTLSINPKWPGTAIGGGGETSRHFISRPPPAPPLTPPELSTTIFTFDDRPQPGEDNSFMRQPNPDYLSSTSSILSANTASPSSVPRRRSYNRTLPIGVPIPSLSQAQGTSDVADESFAPSSYPPGSPLPPPAPLAAGAKEIDVRGEVVGVLDAEGAGWTRHTRVYGGGVCLACAASGGDHGGFYGATVRPEDMR